MSSATTRLEARISTDLHAIAQPEIMRLSAVDQVCFAQALLSLPTAPAALERAFAQRSQLLSDSAMSGAPALAK